MPIRQEGLTLYQQLEVIRRDIQKAESAEEIENLIEYRREILDAIEERQFQEDHISEYRDRDKGRKASETGRSHSIEYGSQVWRKVWED